jgi:hypothetical protein
MPEKKKDYKRVFFTQPIIKEVIRTFIDGLKTEEKSNENNVYAIKTPLEEWHYDTEEEFFANYIKDFDNALLSKSFLSSDSEITFWIFEPKYSKHLHTEVSVKMPTREHVEKVFNIIESYIDKCRIPEPLPEKYNIKIFIGHGRNVQWKDLKDHLHEKHGINIEAYEIGARGGLTIKEVLEKMLSSSNFALLVFTGEDTDKKNELHARENVIHELGLFQGKLGWQRAIILLEEGVKEVSNIDGIEQIRFKKSNIKETFGDVIATIKREFPDSV